MGLQRTTDTSALALEATLAAMKGTGWSTQTLVAIYNAITGIDISPLALEATLTAIKGSGWSTQTLKAIYDLLATKDLSALALEATLTAMKGTGWSTETLKAIYDVIAALNNITAASVWSVTTRVLSDYSGVWSVATRALTDKANFTLAAAEYDNIRKSVCLTGDTASSIGKILYDLYITTIPAVKTQTDKVPNLRFSDKLPTTPVVENVASAAATSLTAGSVTPTYPSGATRQHALLFAFLHVSNQSAATHNIGLTIQGQKAAGGYSALLTLTAVVPISLINVAGVMATFAVVIDVTTLVDTSAAQYDFRFVVDSDNAGSVNYTSNFTLELIYSI